MNPFDLPNPLDDLVITAGCEAAHPDRRGGQHVAMACVAVRIVHRPTGLEVLVVEHASQRTLMSRAARELIHKMCMREPGGPEVHQAVIDWLMDLATSPDGGRG